MQQHSGNILNQVIWKKCSNRPLRVNCVQPSGTKPDEVLSVVCRVLKKETRKLQIVTLKHPKSFSFKQLCLSEGLKNNFLFTKRQSNFPARSTCLGLNSHFSGTTSVTDWHFPCSSSSSRVLTWLLSGWSGSVLQRKMFRLSVWSLTQNTRTAPLNAALKRRTALQSAGNVRRLSAGRERSRGWLCDGGTCEHCFTCETSALPPTAAHLTDTC